MPFFVQPFAAARIYCMVMARGGESMREWQGVRGDVDDMIFVDDWFVSER